MHWHIADWRIGRLNGGVKTMRREMDRVALSERVNEVTLYEHLDLASPFCPVHLLQFVVHSIPFLS